MFPSSPFRCFGPSTLLNIASSSLARTSTTVFVGVDSTVINMFSCVSGKPRITEARWLNGKVVLFRVNCASFSQKSSVILVAICHLVDLPQVDLMNFRHLVALLMFFFPADYHRFCVGLRRFECAFRCPHY